jgi:ubiquitin-protein ligase
MDSPINDSNVWQQPLAAQATYLTEQNLPARFAEVFGMGQRARALLAASGMPQESIPGESTDPRTFWLLVFQQFGFGIIANGFQQLLDQASQLYPFHPTFSRFARTADAPPRDVPASQEPHGASVTIQGQVDPFTILDTARRLAGPLGIGTVNLGITSAGGILLDLPGASAEAAERLGAAIENDLTGRRIAVRTRTGAAEFREYLIHRLFVEGPDQSHFQLTDVPASTRIRDIARSVGNEYDKKMWDSGPSDGPRPTVVNRQHDDGRVERLRPDSTLHDNRIGEDATLHVAPESTAGINPNERDEALVRVKRQVQRFRDSTPGFDVTVNAKFAPTAYVFRFEAPGWAPPPSPGGVPVEHDHHEVYLVLPPDFPARAPDVYFLSPIFHPNIAPNEKGGKVCLGDLQKGYRPAMDFGELCRMLIEMACYRNYTLREYYNGDAKDWADSPAGRAAIKRRGGVPWHERQHPPDEELLWPLTITRMTGHE